MPANIIDGRLLAEKIQEQVRQEIIQLGFAPGLAVFLIGDDEASKVYVRLKEKACKEVGIDFHKYLSTGQGGTDELLDAIRFINQDASVNAILVQLPLPEGFDTQTIIDAIDPAKDVDGFHPETLKRFLTGASNFLPGLSLGIIRLIESTQEPLQGKKAVILANSEIFSAPLVKLLTDRGLEVDVVPADDKNIDTRTAQGDVLIVAIGRPGFVGADMVKTGAIVIDVGTTKVDGQIFGDVDFESVSEKASHITPVPGGVGPVTVAMLLENTVKLAKQHQQVQ
ncbi:MAG: bifunctional 5,10-methylenetetrahydrofolate dehydrogenase/5,10-methenyltetrahydrofolate cyclohydrolase [Parcubacteria group bacterium]|nr:bifunctional 5,10-methylenetetrahydrofolate dehydrogenase/5,10-methenyltetrahydrofolate cyclohydrolase [Parcubacteria group bacterium]